MKLTCTIEAGMTDLTDAQAFGDLPFEFDTFTTNAAATAYYDSDTGVLIIHSDPVAIAFSHYEMSQLHATLSAFLVL